MKSSATDVSAYLDGLPADRREALTELLAVIRKNLPKGYEEAFEWGMITWQVPLSVYPDTYNKKPLMYAALASQKSHIAVYLTNVYGDPKLRAKFEAEWAKSAGKKLDMGKSCVRFGKLADASLPAIGAAVAATPMDDLVAFAKSVRAQKPSERAGKAAPAAKKAAPAAKKAAPAAKKTAKKVAPAAKKIAKKAASPAKRTTKKA